MLKKKYRLPAEIRLKSPLSRDFKSFILKSKENTFSYPRFAFVISKNVDKRAVIRNKLKREMTRVVSGLLEKAGGNDYIFLLKRGSAENIGKLEKEIRDILQ